MIAGWDGQYQSCMGDFVVVLLFIANFTFVIGILCVVNLLFPLFIVVTD